MKIINDINKETKEFQDRALDTMCINESHIVHPWWYNFKYLAVGIIFGIVFVQYASNLIHFLPATRGHIHGRLLRISAESRNDYRIRFCEILDFPLPNTWNNITPNIQKIFHSP